MSEYEAGRELDALIAEKVMGFEWRRWAFSAGPKLKWLVSPEHRATFTWGSEDLQGDETIAQDFARDVPGYSTSIADAWLVVERMREIGWAVDLGDQQHGCGGGPERVWHVMMTGTDAQRWSCNKSAPLAICKAALAALTPGDGIQEGDRG